MDPIDMWKETIDDDGGPALTVVDSEGQSLDIRVGPIWVNGEQLPHPVIWIEYQEQHLKSELKGPVLVSIEGWRQINQLVEDRLGEQTEEKNKAG